MYNFRYVLFPLRKATVAVRVTKFPNLQHSYTPKEYKCYVFFSK